MRVLPLVLLLAGCAAAPTGTPEPPAEPTKPPPEEKAANPEPSEDHLAAARESRSRAKEAADRGDGTTAQLHLLDAKAAAERALAAAPADREALREAGRIERDSFRFAEGAARFRAALEGAPERDGETVYDLAYCLAYAGDFAAALPLFLEAERLLGPRPLITVNAAICEERTGKRAAGVARLARFYADERAAGRDGRLALEKTWDLTVQKRDYEAGIAAFRALEAAHPDRSEPPFMLGNLLSFLNRHAEAAEAYGRSIRLTPLPAAVARKARELAATGPDQRHAAAAAVRIAIEVAADQPETVPAALRVSRYHLAASEPGEAWDIAASAGRAAGWTVDLSLAEGDAHLAAGRMDDACRSYSRAQELDSFGTAAMARLSRASLALARGEGAAEPSQFDAPAAPLDPVPPKEVLLDFEDAAVFVHPLRGAAFAEGAFRPGAAGRVYLHFFPDLDARRWPRLLLRVRTDGPGTLRLHLADGYDQMADEPPGWLHLAEEFPVDREWRFVSVPLRAFVPDGTGRTTGTDLSRVKCAILEFTARPWIDSVALSDEAAKETRMLQSFDGPVEETAFVFDGTTTPFTRVVANPGILADLVPTGSGPISPAILAAQNGSFEPPLVGRGIGAVRLRHGDASVFPSKGAPRTPMLDGPGAGVVRLNPDRDLQRFRFLTFLARGEKGGERLRVRLVDAHGLALEAFLPTSRWPRSVFPRTAKADGAIVLGTEWRMFRVPLEEYPELDRAALSEIRFEVGSEAGNRPGATMLLDEIGLEY